MALITNLNALLEELDYSNKTPGQQAQIDALIEVSSELIEKYCNRHFLLDTYIDEKHNGNNKNSLFLDNIPIVSIDLITIEASGGLGADTDFDGSYFKFDTSDGEIQWDNNYLLQNAVVDWIGHFPQGFNNILVTYDGGFTEVPKPIEFACADLVKQGFSPEMGFGNLEFEKLGQYFYKLRKEQIDKALLTHRKILQMYKLYRV